MVKREPRLVTDHNDLTKRPPYSKRKVAILMGYCGTNYQGMQLNPNAKTIEKDLFDALCKDGLVSADNAIDPKKISWMRACRTDKGVHAAGQVVSLKMLVKTDTGSEGRILDETEALDATTMRLNSILPKDIRIFAIKRAASSFHSKERCDSRFYEYLLPTYSLAPASSEPYIKPISRPFEGGREYKANSKAISELIRESGFEDEDDEEEALEGFEPISIEEKWECRLTEGEKQLIESYRIDPDRLARLRAMLHYYEGSRMYHNFTIGKSSSDPSVRRIIHSVTVSDPFQQGNMEWVSLTFHGQSFMLHQIRKMVGLAILAIRLNCDWKSLLDHCFGRGKVNIPKAPALGLLLDKAIFTNYNKKFTGARDAINFDDFAKERQQLCNELIYPQIYDEEIKFNRFMGWIKCNDDHGSEFGFLVPFITSSSSSLTLPTVQS